ncbi:helix-turn-helix transcriptional regulator [Pseudidiomarina homiensis]|uniref:Transcriptional regulator n=1 Tax=Pseudidiomarina homiensis TaxID=364198 RepID=A0A432Y6M7_9GAMM|nr:helix-turn-helix transcriptional regulator [Pseudidiomarina homiensis]RUO56597.1 transcriptional regulator [Pseudidiomarina homiensis]
MPKSIARTYSRYTEDALAVLASLIRSARVQQRISAQQLAERAGISRSTLQRIEKADPKCEIGIVFELASLLGIALFDASPSSGELRRYRTLQEEKLTLLPERVRQPAREVDDDF